MWRRPEDIKKLRIEIFRSKLDFGCQLYSNSTPEKLKKLDSIHREGIKIYMGAFKTSLIETLYIEENDLSLQLRKINLGLRFLYKQKSNPTYTEILTTSLMITKEPSLSDLT